VVIALTRCLKTISQRKTENEEVVVTAMAGARLQTLCSFAIDHGLEGMNFAIGIPGTVGGAIMMNAGTSRGSMERVVKSINLLCPRGQTQRITREKLNFSYRKLTWGEGRNEMLPGQRKSSVRDAQCRMFF
jgi:UDP-N-acetylmuramate dehydrogenase